MKYRFAPALALGLVLPVLSVSVAHAQLTGGLGDFSLGGQGAQRPAESLDKIVAVVNSDVILESELDAAIAQFRQEQPQALAGQTSSAALRSQVLDQLILRQLQIQQAKQDGIKVSTTELQQGMARIAQRNNMNLQQFAQAVSSSGMSMGALRERVRDEILISKVRRKDVMGKVAVTDADVDRYLQNQALRLSQGHEFKLREIRIDLPAGADSTTVGVARSRLERLRSRITAGELDFAQAAADVSTAPDAANGGDMGWVAGTNLPDSFDAALADLSTGQISGVFRGQDGVYLVQLEGERGGSADSDTNTSQVMVTEADLQHIVLRPNEIRNDARTRELARTIRQRLAAGDDFGTLAKQYSDDKATANQGGDVGWIPLDRLAPSTRRHISALSEGDVSRVFQSGNGYEIVKLNGERQRDETEQAKRDKVRQTLGRQRTTDEGNRWLRKLRDEAYIDIRMPGYQQTPGPGA